MKDANGNYRMTVEGAKPGAAPVKKREVPELRVSIKKILEKPKP